MLFQKETWLESNGLKYKKNHGAIILLLNYLVVSRFERRGFILHTQKKVVALPYVTSYAKNGSKLQWFPPCPRHVDSIKIKQNHAWHKGIKFYLMKYLFLYFPFSKEIFKIVMP